MICLTFRHWSWSLIPETHQYQRIRHFSHWIPFECALSFGAQGQVQKGTQEECRCWSKRWQCWTLPVSCCLITDISKAHFSSFQLPKHTPSGTSVLAGLGSKYISLLLSFDLCPTQSVNTLWKCSETFFLFFINRSRGPDFINKIDQSDMMVKIQTQFHPLSMGIQLQASYLWRVCSRHQTIFYFVCVWYSPTELTLLKRWR